MLDTQGRYTNGNNAEELVKLDRDKIIKLAAYNAILTCIVLIVAMNVLPVLHVDPAGTLVLGLVWGAAITMGSYILLRIGGRK